MSGDRAGPKISSGWGEVEKLSAAKYRLRLKPDLLEQFPVTGTEAVLGPYLHNYRGWVLVDSKLGFRYTGGWMP